MSTQKKASSTPTRPWEPYNTLGIPEHLKDPNYDYRWCDNTPQNISRKQMEGWLIDSNISKSFEPNVPVDYPKSLTSATAVATMVLMKLPKVLAKQREEYYANITKGNSEQIDRNFSENILKDAPQGKIYEDASKGNKLS